MPPHDTLLFEGPVELVFPQQCDEWRSASTTALPFSPTTKDDDSSSTSSFSVTRRRRRRRRVSISEEFNQVYEISKADSDLKNDLWYNEGTMASSQVFIPNTCKLLTLAVLFRDISPSCLFPPLEWKVAAIRRVMVSTIFQQRKL
eukprot:scaffold1982_cov93-Amphora_coffeaeformis.AAC.30